MLLQRTMGILKRAFSVKKVQIFINDKPYMVDSNLTIFQAAKLQGIIIPRFCYHERLKIAGNCRMCLVEVAKSPKPVASCCSNVMPAMRVYTQSETTRLARGGVMQFILANHPLDCPICDQGGECDLQNNAIQFGYNYSRFLQEKRAVEDKNFGPLVVTHMNRCIHCTRCIRFSEEIAGYHDLGTTGRGRATEIGTYVQKMLHSEMSGNLADVCPVGALNHGPTAYSVRGYEVKQKQTIDVMQTLGSAIEVSYKGEQVVRVKPVTNQQINQEWISDKTRNSYDGLKRQRLTVPLVRVGSDFQEVKWERALDIAAQKINSVQGKHICASVGQLSDLQTLTAVRDFLHRLGGECFEFRHNFRVNASHQFRSNYLFNSRIQGVEDTDHILLIGCNPRVDSPVLNSRILKAVRNKKTKVSLVGPASDLTYEYNHLGSATSILNDILQGKHQICGELQKAKLPMIILGFDALTRADSQAIQAISRKIANKYKIINPQNKWNGFNVLQRHSGILNALQLGIDLNKVCQKPKVLLLLNDNNIQLEDVPKDCFVIFVGSHGDHGASFADLILPGSNFMEKSGTFVNLQGRVQLANKIVQPPGHAKEDWMIFRALSQNLGIKLPYNTLEQLRERMSLLSPHLLKYNYIQNSVFGKVSQQCLKEGVLGQAGLTEGVDNYYMTEGVSRSSIVMAKCSIAFNSLKNNNFRRLQM